MKDVHYQTTIGTYLVNIRLTDYGDRLDDYEPYWKWFIRVEDTQKQWLVEQNGPMGGYVESYEEAIEEALTELTQLQELELGEETVETLRENIKKRKDT